jgi:PmbA protein
VTESSGWAEGCRADATSETEAGRLHGSAAGGDYGMEGRHEVSVEAGMENSHQRSRGRLPIGPQDAILPHNKNAQTAAAGLSMMSPDQCATIFEIAQQAARAANIRDIEVLISAKQSALTRFANNVIHQNVSEQSHWASVRTVIGQRTARATTNRLDESGIRRAVEESLALTRSVDPLPDLLELAEPQPLTPVSRYDAGTAATGPEQRARAVTEAIRVIEAASQTAAGIFSTEHAIEAIFNSRGVAAHYAETRAVFSITAMDGDSSGWAKASEVSSRDLDTVALARTASLKARLSHSPREIPPGHYTVVLEPAAVLDVVGQMFGDFSGTALADQRSFLMNRMGERVFGENIHIDDDVYHPLQAGPAFDGEGMPRKRLTLVDGGVPRELAWSRNSAAKAGVAPTGHGFPLPNEIGEAPLNIVVRGGQTSVAEMIASVDHGVLVTRLWYIREVDPYEKIMTGMTRDGTFLIEDGKVTCGLKNFRFNESLLRMLSNVEALSPSLRASGEEAFDMVVPAMKVTDFHFTEVTRF